MACDIVGMLITLITLGPLLESDPTVLTATATFLLTTL